VPRRAGLTADPRRRGAGPLAGPDRRPRGARVPTLTRVRRIRAAMRERNPETLEEKLSYLRDLREQAVHSASEQAIEKQHAKGKLTARERIDKLLDPGS